MRIFYLLALMLLGALPLALTGCNFWDTDDTPANAQPVAIAGGNQSVFTGVQVVLDGSGSSDQDGDTLSYAWSLTGAPAGSLAVITDATSAIAHLTPDVAGSYTVQLLVHDGKRYSAPATLVVTAAPENRAPVANGGPDQSATIGIPVILNGNGSYDPDANPLTYAWSLLEKPLGSSVFLTSTTYPTTSLTPDLYGQYIVQLVVNDGAVESVSDTVWVTANNLRPVADAGSDQTLVKGSMAVLHGSASSDPNKDPLTYHWSFYSKPAGSSAELSDADTRWPWFPAEEAGVHLIQLVVNDGKTDSAGDMVRVFVARLPIPLPDTGQTTSYTETFGEDHDYTINPPSYTIGTTAAEGTVTDNVTGLMWQRQENNVGGTWDEAMLYCDNLELAGHSDWRLPSKKELVGLINSGSTAPSIDTDAFPGTQSGGYWSSTSYGHDSQGAWEVAFGGTNAVISHKLFRYYVRCVRGGPWSIEFLSLPLGCEQGIIYSILPTGCQTNTP